MIIKHNIKEQCDLYCDFAKEMLKKTGVSSLEDMIEWKGLRFIPQKAHVPLTASPQLQSVVVYMTLVPKEIQDNGTNYQKKVMQYGPFYLESWRALKDDISFAEDYITKKINKYLDKEKSNEETT